MRLAEAIVKRRVDQLVPYASNSRTHSAKQIAQIAASIKEFGFTNPVLVDGEGAIMAGHARVLAAKELGLKQVPTIDIGYLSETQRQAYVIADNKLAENAGWDQEMLRLELGDLRDAGFDLRLAASRNRASRSATSGFGSSLIRRPSSQFPAPKHLQSTYPARLEIGESL